MKSPKGAAALLIGLGSSKKAPPAPDSSASEMEHSGDDDDSSTGEALATDLIDAVKSGDASGVLDAFKALSEHCSYEE